MRQIRPIAATEWQQYRDLRLQALQESPDAFGSTYDAERRKTDRDWRVQIEAANASGRDRVFFALDGQQACGLVWCRLSSADARTADLYQMWVAPSARGSGAGHALLHAAVGWARQQAARVVRLGVTQAESPAMHLYRSHGFLAIGTPAPLRPGSPLLAQTLELQLGAD